jgi:hypothetical protein
MPENNTFTGSERKTKRPRIITYLSILAFVFSIFHLIRFSQALIQRDILIDLPLSISPLYLVVSGLVWGLSALVLVWSLWTGRSWARAFCLIFSLIYTFFFWIDLIWVADPIVLQTRWLFNLGLTLLALTSIYLILKSESSRNYFNRNPATID